MNDDYIKEQQKRIEEIVEIKVATTRKYIRLILESVFLAGKIEGLKELGKSL